MDEAALRFMSSSVVGKGKECACLEQALVLLQLQCSTG